MGTDKRARQKANRDRARQERIRKQKMTTVRKRGLLLGVGIPAIIGVLFLISNFVMNDSSSDTAVDAALDLTPEPNATIPGLQITGKTPCPKTDGTEARVTIFEQAPTMCIDPAKSYTAIFNTSEGVIEVALDTKKTPSTVNNFVTLSRYGYYDTSFIFALTQTLTSFRAAVQTTPMVLATQSKMKALALRTQKATLSWRVVQAPIPAVDSSSSSLVRRLQFLTAKAPMSPSVKLRRALMSLRRSWH